jgi:hypothetical protein
MTQLNINTIHSILPDNNRKNADWLRGEHYTFVDPRHQHHHFHFNVRVSALARVGRVVIVVAQGRMQH